MITLYKVSHPNNYCCRLKVLPAILMMSSAVTTVMALRPSHYNHGPMGNPPPHSSSSAAATSSSSNIDFDYDPYSSPQQSSSSLLSTTTPMDDHQSVEERLAAWRKQQQFKYENQSPLEEANPREEDGRMKLLASVSKGSISLFFFILMWRSVHHYELADQSFKGSVRLIMVLPTVILFLGNMVGCVASLMSSSSTSASRNSKKRMKAVLNLNKLVELCLIIYNVFRLIFFPSKYILKEVYVGRTLTNFLFIIQCQLFTKVTW